jgi:mRNA interferase MazF
MHRGEIYLVDLNNHVGSEQTGIRPAIIVQNDAGNSHSPTTIICPLTSQRKPSMMTHVALSPKDCGIIKESIVLCEQICVIDKSLVKKKLGEVRNKAKIEEFNKKLLISIGIEGTYLEQNN